MTSRIDDGDWSTETAQVCTWNLLSPKLKPEQADVVIDAPAAVSALSCHPKHAALLAGREAAPRGHSRSSRLRRARARVCVLCV